MSIIERLEKLRRRHHYCEDSWYSCPKHEDGCANDGEGNECTCGADNFNSELDAIVSEVRKISEVIGTQPTVNQQLKAEIATLANHMAAVHNTGARINVPYFVEQMRQLSAV